MRNKDQILLESIYEKIFNEKYWESRKEPRDELSKFGYFDADKLLGERVWVHTNRTNRKEGRNGMYGVYIPVMKDGKETYSDVRYGYTNEIRLSNVFFDVDEPCIKGIQNKNKRTLCAGIAGTITKTEGNLSGFEEFTFDPFSGIYGYYIKNDPEKKIITKANEVYMNSMEDGTYITMGKGILTEK